MATGAALPLLVQFYLAYRYTGQLPWSLYEGPAAEVAMVFAIEAGVEDLLMQMKPEKPDGG